MPPGKTDKLERAQEMAYDAMQFTGKKRAKLLREALAVCPDCADAYIFLADDVDDVEERIELLELAIKAAERALGRDWQKRYEGAFWQATETRPIMRAMGRLAVALQSEGEMDAALYLYRELIRMNPNDDQGNRYGYASCLFEAKEDDDLEKLFEQYKDDPAADFQYAVALALFRKQGASEQADAALRKAFKSNPFVPLYLSDVIEMPDEAPSDFDLGDEGEAIAYTIDRQFLWYNTEGATKWMASTLKSELNAEYADDREMVREVLDGLNEVVDE